jgi:hypothetical protein
VGHDEVGDHQLEGLREESLERLGAVLRQGDLVPALAQLGGEELAEESVVVSDENPGCGHGVLQGRTFPYTASYTSYKSVEKRSNLHGLDEV